MLFKICVFYNEVMKKSKIFLIVFLFLLPVSLFIGGRKTFATINLQEFGSGKEGVNQAAWNWESFGDQVFAIFTGIFGDIGVSSTSPVTSQIEIDNGKEKGALAFTTQLIGSLYDARPASGVYYAYDVLKNVGAAPAYAQGVGFSGLQPLLPVWKAFRNVTYLLFTIIFIVMGLMIMFRLKISQQAVMTIENAIPKIVGGLILVTFSYAIAGLLIDLMYVVIALGIFLLQAAGVTFAGLPTAAEIINGGFFTLLTPMAAFGKGGIKLGSIIGSLIGSLVGMGGMGGAVGMTISNFVPFIGQLIMGANAATGAAIGIVIALLVLGIIYIFLFFKLFMSLVKSYIRIILAIILGPLQIMMGAIPGVKTAGFGGWIKGILADILVFPAVVIVAIIGCYLIYVTQQGQSLWLAPLIGLGSQAATDAAFVQTIIGLGFLLVIATVPDVVRGALGVKASPFESAIGQAVAPGLATMAWPFKEYFGLQKQAREKAAVEQMVTGIRTGGWQQWWPFGGKEETPTAEVKKPTPTNPLAQARNQMRTQTQMPPRHMPNP